MRDNRIYKNERNPLKRPILLNQEKEIGNVKIIIPCQE